PPGSPGLKLFLVEKQVTASRLMVTNLRAKAGPRFFYFSVDMPHVLTSLSCGTATGVRMPETKLDLLQGTLDLLVLQTLESMGSLHGYGIARRIEQVSGNEVLLNPGTIYASLVRLQQRGWISAKWGTSDNNRRAKYYSISRAGRKQLAQETANWERLSAVITRVLSASGGVR